MPETTRQELIDSVINKEIDKSSEAADNNFPRNYQTCIHFYQVLRSIAHSGMEINIFSLLQLKVTLLKVIYHCKTCERLKPIWHEHNYVIYINRSFFSLISNVRYYYLTNHTARKYHNKSLSSHASLLPNHLWHFG